ncbi:alpha/beta hydrolase [Blastomonas sp.]|uniref:alpha/beta hydrolase n=1 Tax=Blastomonas sp. TaxID=1909299 RepID=UPI00406A338B
MTEQAKAAPDESDALVTVSGVEVACRLRLAAGAPKGAVLILPGSLYSDVDGNYPAMNLRTHAYADLARQLAARGFASLRMAKIGPGTGSRVIDADAAQKHRDFAMRVVVAEAGLDLLQRSVTASPLLVAGHSEGAVVASLLAQGPAGAHLAGVVSLSGPALRLLTLMRDQVAAMAPPGVPPQLAMFDRTVAAIRADEPVPAEALADPSSTMLASMPPPAHAYLRSVDAVDPLAEIARVEQPVLIVQGGRDDSVPPAHADQLRAARATLPTRMAFFEELTHFYKQAPKGMAPMQAMALESDSDPGVADAIARWALALAQAG